MKYLVADLTRANPGSEARLLAPFVKADDVAGIWVVGFEHQSEPIAAAAPQAEFVALRSNAHYTEIVADVVKTVDARLAEADGATPIVDDLEVLSFHSAVLALSQRYTEQTPIPVQFVAWMDAIRDAQSADGHSVTAWPEELMSAEEACSIFKATLEESPRPIRMSELRFALARVDERFDKSYSSASAMPGLLKLLVEMAKERNFLRIEMTRPNDVNPFLHPLQRKSEGKKGQEATDGATQADERSRMMEQILRARNLGPFSRIRALLFDKLEEASAQSVTLERMIATCINSTRDECGQRGYPWRAVRQFVVTLMQRRPIALDQSGAVIVPNTLGRLETVSGLRENWRMDWEGELVVALVQEMDDLHPAYDTVNLALLLHHTGEPDVCTRVHEVVAHLIRTGRVCEDEGTEHLRTVDDTVEKPESGLRSVPRQSGGEG